MFSKPSSKNDTCFGDIVLCRCKLPEAQKKWRDKNEFTEKKNVRQVAHEKYYLLALVLASP